VSRGRRFDSPSAAATAAWAARLAPLLASGTVLLLDGELGAGKTTFVRGLARGLGVKCAVRSPTFQLVREYHPLVHVDLYRLNAGDVAMLGLDDYLDGRHVIALEWGSRAGPDYDWGDASVMRLDFEMVGPRRRRITLSLDERLPGPLLTLLESLTCAL